ncbi:uncharacterized protein LOC130276792 [Hyla sarda]|uniref:uncharacterized protein LOC130276792 n=1 Tax=Hyla sarda TaxID=327740 RepID=UPI0024C2F645|nr:uncharacterized protein LOC130276792 [Hyla sarda]XP_056382647.1 uncharacterized protein LOC130276792 [Hyla sarda]XP_056382648.1 uncharacterized protein LOC130276792 [Hyla sarda]
MPMKDIWCYSEAQKNVLERFQKEWEPPAVPCATPMTTFLKKRICEPISNVHPAHSNPKHLNSDEIPQRRLCASYNLQLNDLHVPTTRNIYQNGMQKIIPGGKTWHNELCASDPVRNILGKRDYLKTPKVHDILLKYGGPEASTVKPTLLTRKTLPEKIIPTYEVNVKNTKNLFFMPQNKLRVGNLHPKRYHMQQKKKVPFIF